MKWEKEVNEELKPCPFCGGKAYVGIYEYATIVICDQCGAQTAEVGISPYYAAKDEAIKRWNKREGGRDGMDG